MTKIELYRNCAAQCLALARIAERTGDHHRLIDLAADWIERADSLERQIGPPEPFTPLLSPWRALSAVSLIEPTRH